ncbi:hemolysin III family protein [Chitinimonas arctica]|uniref:Hemolysin III family protein n=1 Tax=Chitinimonas arctica TaxID=2594795 RepID=A0A516SDL6_9NEIS|nr:hemolysin III family protein [Chitinimonas arctica]QDQ26230.1 hemolysin III family protein [Chitinimonas arctica]
MYHGERFNSISHLIGSIFSVTGLVVLVVLASLQGDPWKIVSFSIYGATLVVLYTASTVYHSIRQPRAKAWLRKLDHSAIYLLIAGSYTPFALITLRGTWGWLLFGLSWGLAIFGIAQELTLGRRTRVLSLILYVVMGWLVLIAIKPLMAALPAGGLAWLAAGGVVYSLGIYFYLNDERVRHYHGIWHLFVLGGSICQYVSVLFYVA